MNGVSETKASFTFLIIMKEEIVRDTARKRMEDLSHSFGNDKLY